MSDRILSASAAPAEALHEEMARDDTIFILGEDLTAHAGIFGQFKGIPEKFPGRILDTPISEACIAGCGVGAALTGMRPVVDFHFADFVTCGMDEFCIQAELFDHLDAPVLRVAARDVPIPFSPPMEDFVLPKAADVIAAVQAVCYR